MTKFPTTKFMIWKLMNVTTESFTYHTLCRRCNQYIGSSKYVKSTQKFACGYTTSTGSFFIEIDIEDQLKKFFSNKNVVKNFNYTVSLFGRQCCDLSTLTAWQIGVFGPKWWTGWRERRFRALPRSAWVRLALTTPRARLRGLDQGRESIIN